MRWNWRGLIERLFRRPSQSQTQDAAPCTPSTEWAVNLSQYNFLDYREGLPVELVDAIRSAADGAFDVVAPAGCRWRRGWAIAQQKPLPWPYMYDCIKISLKDFVIQLPPDLVPAFQRHIINPRLGEKIYAWYDTTACAVKVMAYTGDYEEEESPGYDGFGRYDKNDEIVEGLVTAEGEWLEAPKCRYL